jgi:hypothetical protein
MLLAERAHQLAKKAGGDRRADADANCAFLASAGRTRRPDRVI